MASLLVYVYALGLPLIGAIIAWTAILIARSSIVSSSSGSAEPSRMRARIIAYLEHSSTPLVFGAVLTFLISRKTGSTPDFILESAAMAVGIPAFLAGIGISITYYRGIRKLAKNPAAFGRVLTIAVLPVSTAILGMVVSFLMLGEASMTAESSQLTASLMSVGGIGAVLSAYLATSFDEEWCLTGFSRAIIRGTLGECVTLVFFSLAMLSFGAP